MKSAVESDGILGGILEACGVRDGFACTLEFVPKRKAILKLLTNDLKEFGRDRKAGDNNTNRDLGVGPKTNDTKVVGYIYRLVKCLSICSSYDRCNAGAINKTDQ